MSEKAKGERKRPKELKFVVEGRELKQSEIVKVLQKLGGIDAEFLCTLILKNLILK